MSLESWVELFASYCTQEGELTPRVLITGEGGTGMSYILDDIDSNLWPTWNPKESQENDSEKENEDGPPPLE